MKPVDFEYARAHSIDHALRLLEDAHGEAKVVAGAQSLGPMLNLRLVQPRLLVDIAGIGELTRIEERPDAVVLGACVTSANVEDGRIPERGLRMLRAVATVTAYRAVRNRGTLGGSLCHADPASDWIAA
ncbi:MAG TPA: FAD binding domain-containing protein, partial [Casimicrobiaceae bacterium]|nr:FAD binding domain-containing protein [Casimicrobiaceae bacterium]